MNLVPLAASIAVFTGIGAGIGIALATAKASESVARQPEASSKILQIVILGASLAEATAIYGFITALILIFLG